ncbi:hypothetical protein PGT21_021933 [Puccinia graminis f. sp. tritici]|uniref:Uncharacterized protein n=1 Tax=Puccinia graminis f. sp. tritici TaxID=56615 RepID=A0A5B0RKW5_PUCGR|nr:hypothetical protein PGT21_021933 [Puccinia graminis f. sp. tritici]KAA1125758.1 hypothetical protein PGTUg99_015015 [Puccinia graminis f. sp. tritici]
MSLKIAVWGAAPHQKSPLVSLGYARREFCFFVPALLLSSSNRPPPHIIYSQEKKERGRLTSPHDKTP